MSRVRQQNGRRKTYPKTYRIRSAPAHNHHRKGGNNTHSTQTHEEVHAAQVAARRAAREAAAQEVIVLVAPPVPNVQIDQEVSPVDPLHSRNGPAP